MGLFQTSFFMTCYRSGDLRPVPPASFSNDPFPAGVQLPNAAVVFIYKKKEKLGSAPVPVTYYKAPPATFSWPASVTETNVQIPASFL